MPHNLGRNTFISDLRWKIQYQQSERSGRFHQSFHPNCRTQKWKASWLLGTYLTECADPTTHVAVGNTLNSISEINSIIFYCWFSVFKENLYIDTNPITNIIYITMMVRCSFHAFYQSWLFFSVTWCRTEQFMMVDALDRIAVIH